MTDQEVLDHLRGRHVMGVYPLLEDETCWFVAADFDKALNGIKRLAAFQNPAFYEKQRMRVSTAATPRVISCAEELPGYVALPRAVFPTSRASSRLTVWRSSSRTSGIRATP